MYNSRSMELPSALRHIDRSQFSKFPYLERVEKPWGHEIIFTPPDLPYTGKILNIKKGLECSLQAHDQKEESWYLLSGKVKLFRENKDGEIKECEMHSRVGYTNYVGQIHRFLALKDSEILEVSTPEKGTTYRLADDFDRSDETEKMRSKPNRGWTEN